MIEVRTIDALREARRLAEQAGRAIPRYAALLQEAGRQRPGTYVATPLLPQPWPRPLPPGGVEPKHAAV